MKYISLSFIALCTYSVCICMEEITLSNGTDTFKRQVNIRNVEPKKVSFHTITVRNKTDWTIEARIEGFGVKDINSKLKDWKLYTGGVNILSKGHYPFSIPTSSTQFPITSTLYRLYAHALIVKFQNNADSEIHFPEPLEANFKDFIITSYNTNQGPRLRIEKG